MRILRVELNWNVIFRVQNFLQDLLFENNFFFKTVLLKNTSFLQIHAF